MSPPEDLDRLSHAALKELVVQQWEQIAELRRMVAALRDEIARLKGGPGRPNIKPSGMEQATEPTPAGSSGNRKRTRGSTRSKLLIHEERAWICPDVLRAQEARRPARRARDDARDGVERY
jgi:hypothetical protein